MNTVIITGASSLLGQYLCQYFSQNFKVIGLYNTSVPTLPNIKTEKIDLINNEAVKNIIEQYSPQFVIHTAGYTSVDECESNPQIAHEQNVICTKNICDAFAGYQIKLVQISTDHLFSGSEANYTEEAKVQPLNVYAVTKLQAEQESLKLSNSVIVRTNFYGGHTNKKMSFSSWIFNELKHGRKINMFDDVFFTPISICGLADNLEIIMNSNLNGIYNLVGEERLSKYEFALKLAKEFDLPADLILKTTVENLKLKAKSPHDMSLSTSKIKRDLVSFKPETVYEGLKKINNLKLF